MYELLLKMPHVFAHAAYADTVYVYDFCDESATAAAPVKNTVDGCEIAEFWIEECSPQFATHSVRLVHFPALMIHLNADLNKMWMKLKTFYRWQSVALLLAHEECLRVSVFHRQEYGEQ
jgi:hypothetical protein